METAVKQVTLSTLAEGAADELFLDALGKVLGNIRDLNTDHRFKREIVLKFVLTANEERSVGKIDVSCSTKLAGVKGLSVGVYIGQSEGLLVAVEAPRQEEMFPSPLGHPRAVAIGETDGIVTGMRLRKADGTPA